jgi:myo-inositol 2-dehydrogenase / D-chiro-inositol 1-dehydrogenase
MTAKKLNVGLIGAGRIGKVHAETLAFRVPEARVLAVTDLNLPAAETVAARYGVPTVAASADLVLADRAIEAVLICTSTDTHADLIVRARASREAYLLREADCVDTWRRSMPR